MNYENLLTQVEHWTGLSNRLEAERALNATVAALGSCLSIVDCERWADRLPNELRAMWYVAPYHRAQSAAAVLAQVPAAEGVPQPYATEHAQAVIRLLAAQLPFDDREVLARRLPEPIGNLVLDPQLFEHVADGGERCGNVVPTGRTLATARAGSEHPMSLAQPRAAQSGSVAAWDERRLDRTLAVIRDDI